MSEGTAAKGKKEKKSRVRMPEQEPMVRARNFLEVPTGYTPEMAKEEAARCLQCKNPGCVDGCPVGIDIPGFINFVKEGEFTQSIRHVWTMNSLPAVCGRVCPQETQCEGKCILAKKGEPVAIGNLERFVADWEVLLYGIPEFRLPKEIVAQEVNFLERLGVKVECNAVVGRTVSLDELLVGILSANEYLTRANLMKAYLFPKVDTPIPRGKDVVVLGGGNVAMDSARTALRLGADRVRLVYRRSRDEMPARAAEAHHAEEEGIEFFLLTNPTRYIGNEKGRLTGMECIKMELGEPDASGRRRPVPVKGSEFELPCDLCIVAVGTGANPLLTSSTPDLKINKWGYIEADPKTGKTLKKGVWAGGDIVTGSATVILAMGAGRNAANSIHDYLLRGW